MNSLINTEMINLKITFNEKESDIEFDKYYFNGDKIKNFDNNIDIDNELLAEEGKPIEEKEEVRSIEEIDEVKPIEEIKEEEKPNEQKKRIHKIKKKGKKRHIFYEPEEPKEEKDNIIEEPKEQINYYNTIEQPKNVINYYFNKTEENKPIENNTYEKQYFPFNFFKKGK